MAFVCANSGEDFTFAVVRGKIVNFGFRFFLCVVSFWENDLWRNVCKEGILMMGLLE